MFGNTFRVLALSVALTFAFASAAFADTVTNLLDNSPAPTQFEVVTVNEGETRGVPLRVIATGDDGDSDCNVDSGELLQLGFNSTNNNVAREDPNGSTVTFQDGTDSNTNACGPNSSGGANPPAAAPDDRSITVRGVSRGTANITVATPPVRNTTGRGTYTYGAATFQVVVQNVAPTANDNSYNTNEDNVLTVNAPGVLGNDTDPGNNPLTAVLAGAPQNGTLQFNSNGSFTYTPNENFSGTDTFTYRTSDGQAESGLATVTINVAAVNDRPNAAPDTATTGEDQPAVVNVLDNDTDAEGNPLTVTSNTQPQNGTVNCTPAGICTYTPNTDFNGVDTFSYTVSDGNGGTATATVAVAVGASNDPPNAAGNNYDVDEDGTLNVAGPGVLGNDTDPDNNNLTARLDRGPGNGTLTFNPDGSFVYTPNEDFNGQDSFTYRACDDGIPQICSEPATVEISVNAVNDAPIARGRTVPVDEDGQSVVETLANDSDPDGDTLVLTNVEQPQNGTVSCTPRGDCTYTPNPDFNGQDSYTYTVTDGNGGTGTATVRITVRPVNDAPTAQDNTYSATEDQPLRVGAPGLLANDTDIENNRLRALLETGPSNGTLTFNADGSFVYTPNEDFNGTDTFTYRANDDIDNSNVATVTINVAAANDLPRAQGDAATAREDTPVTIPVLGNDGPGPDDEAGQTLSTDAITVQPDNGRAEINPDGSITYTPNPDFFGEDSFAYRVCDSGDPRACATATVNVVTSAVNDAPRPANDPVNAREDTPLAINVAGNDAPGPRNEAGQVLTVTNVTDPANGTAEIITEGENAGQVRYTPDPNYSGPDSFEYRVCDDGDPQGCEVATVNVTVAPLNDPPAAAADDLAVAEDGTLSFPASELAQNDSAGPGEEGQALTVTQVGNPQNGTVRLVNGRVVFQPDPNYNGPAGFTYTVCDSGDPRACDSTGVVNVAVSAVNDPPAAAGDTADVPEDGSVGINVLANDTDPEGKNDINALSINVVGGPSNGTANVNRLTGEITYTPNQNFSGTDTFTYEVCDGQNVCDRATVTVNVGPVNDAPVAADDRGSTNAAAIVANSYVSQYSTAKAATPTRLFKLDTSRTPFAFGKIGRDIPRPLNAIGYRSTDDALYGYRILGTTRGIVRVDPATGVSKFLGTPRGLPAGGYIAGDVSPDGSTYYLYAQNSGILRVVDLDSFQATSVTLSSRLSIADLAVSPTNGHLYGVASSGALIEVDPGTGQVTSRFLPELKSGGYGAAWFTAAGDLIAYENGDSATRTRGTLYQIQDPTSAPAVVDQETGPYTVGNDGAAFVSPPNPAGLSVGVNVLNNDTDPDNKLDPGSVSVVTQPAFGTTQVNADGSITYTTNATYRGTDSFRYRVCDVGPDPQCSEATVNITAAPTINSASPAGGSAARAE